MLEYIIQLFHIIVILFVLLGPFIFSCSPLILLLHIVLGISLITHWYYNNDVCCLSELEAVLSGNDRVDTFSHRMIAPIYNISEKSWSDVCYILTIVLIFVSLYKLITCDKMKKIIEKIKTNTFFTEETLQLLI